MDTVWLDGSSCLVCRGLLHPPLANTTRLQRNATAGAAIRDLDDASPHILQILNIAWPLIDVLCWYVWLLVWLGDNLARLLE